MKKQQYISSVASNNSNINQKSSPKQVNKEIYIFTKQDILSPPISSLKIQCKKRNIPIIIRENSRELINLINAAKQKTFIVIQSPRQNAIKSSYVFPQTFSFPRNSQLTKVITYPSNIPNTSYSSANNKIQVFDLYQKYFGLKNGTNNNLLVSASNQKIKLRKINSSKDIKYSVLTSAKSKLQLRSTKNKLNKQQLFFQRLLINQSNVNPNSQYSTLSQSILIKDQNFNKNNIYHIYKFNDIKDHVSSLHQKNKLLMLIDEQNLNNALQFIEKSRITSKIQLIVFGELNSNNKQLLASNVLFASNNPFQIIDKLDKIEFTKTMDCKKQFQLLKQKNKQRFLKTQAKLLESKNSIENQIINNPKQTIKQSKQSINLPKLQNNAQKSVNISNKNQTNSLKAENGTPRFDRPQIFQSKANDNRSKQSIFSNTSSQQQRYMRNWIVEQDPKNNGNYIQFEQSKQQIPPQSIPMSIRASRITSSKKNLSSESDISLFKGNNNITTTGQFGYANGNNIANNNMTINHKNKQTNLIQSRVQVTTTNNKSFVIQQINSNKNILPAFKQQQKQFSLQQNKLNIQLSQSNASATSSNPNSKKIIKLTNSKKSQNKINNSNTQIEQINNSNKQMQVNSNDFIGSINGKQIGSNTILNISNVNSNISNITFNNNQNKKVYSIPSNVIHQLSQQYRGSNRESNINLQEFNNLLKQHVNQLSNQSLPTLNATNKVIYSTPSPNNNKSQINLHSFTTNKNQTISPVAMQQILFNQKQKLNKQEIKEGNKFIVKKMQSLNPDNFNLLKIDSIQSNYKQQSNQNITNSNQYLDHLIRNDDILNKLGYNNNNFIENIPFLNQTNNIIDGKTGQIIIQQIKQIYNQQNIPIQLNKQDLKEPYIIDGKNGQLQLKSFQRFNDNIIVKGFNNLQNNYKIQNNYDKQINNQSNNITKLGYSNQVNKKVSIQNQVKPAQQQIKQKKSIKIIQANKNIIVAPQIQFIKSAQDFNQLNNNLNSSSSNNTVNMNNLIKKNYISNNQSTYRISKPLDAQTIHFQLNSNNESGTSIKLPITTTLLNKNQKNQNNDSEQKDPNITTTKKIAQNNTNNRYISMKPGKVQSYTYKNYDNSQSNFSSQQHLNNNDINYVKYSSNNLNNDYNHNNNYISATNQRVYTLSSPKDYINNHQKNQANKNIIYPTTQYHYQYQPGTTIIEYQPGTKRQNIITYITQPQQQNYYSVNSRPQTNYITHYASSKQPQVIERVYIKTKDLPHHHKTIQTIQRRQRISSRDKSPNIRQISKLSNKSNSNNNSQDFSYKLSPQDQDPFHQKNSMSSNMYNASNISKSKKKKSGSYLKRRQDGKRDPFSPYNYQKEYEKEKQKQASKIQRRKSKLRQNTIQKQKQKEKSILIQKILLTNPNYEQKAYYISPSKQVGSIRTYTAEQYKRVLQNRQKNNKSPTISNNYSTVNIPKPYLSNNNTNNYSPTNYQFYNPLKIQRTQFHYPSHNEIRQIRSNSINRLSGLNNIDFDKFQKTINNNGIVIYKQKTKTKNQDILEKKYIVSNLQGDSNQRDNNLINKISNQQYKKDNVVIYEPSGRQYANSPYRRDSGQQNGLKQQNPLRRLNYNKNYETYRVSKAGSKITNPLKSAQQYIKPLIYNDRSPLKVTQYKTENKYTYNSPNKHVFERQQLYQPRVQASYFNSAQQNLKFNQIENSKNNFTFHQIEQNKNQNKQKNNQYIIKLEQQNYSQNKSQNNRISQIGDISDNSLLKRNNIKFGINKYKKLEIKGDQSYYLEQLRSKLKDKTTNRSSWISKTCELKKNILTQQQILCEIQNYNYVSTKLNCFHFLIDQDMKHIFNWITNNLGTKNDKIQTFRGIDDLYQKMKISFNINSDITTQFYDNGFIFANHQQMNKINKKYIPEDYYLVQIKKQNNKKRQQKNKECLSLNSKDKQIKLDKLYYLKLVQKIVIQAKLTNIILYQKSNKFSQDLNKLMGEIVQLFPSFSQNQQSFIKECFDQQLLIESIQPLIQDAFLTRIYLIINEKQLKNTLQVIEKINDISFIPKQIFFIMILNGQISFGDNKKKLQNKQRSDIIFKNIKQIPNNIFQLINRQNYKQLLQFISKQISIDQNIQLNCKIENIHMQSGINLLTNKQLIEEKQLKKQKIYYYYQHSFQNQIHSSDTLIELIQKQFPSRFKFQSFRSIYEVEQNILDKDKKLIKSQTSIKSKNINHTQINQSSQNNKNTINYILLHPSLSDQSVDNKLFQKVFMLGKAQKVQKNVIRISNRLELIQLLRN